MRGKGRQKYMITKTCLHEVGYLFTISFKVNELVDVIN